MQEREKEEATGWHKSVSLMAAFLGSSVQSTENTALSKSNFFDWGETFKRFEFLLVINLERREGCHSTKLESKRQRKPRQCKLHLAKILAISSFRD